MKQKIVKAYIYDSDVVKVEDRSTLLEWMRTELHKQGIDNGIPYDSRYQPQSKRTQFVQLQPVSA